MTAVFGSNCDFSFQTIPAARRIEGRPCGQFPSGSTSHPSSHSAGAFSELVFLPVVFGKLSPVPGDVSGEKVRRTLSALFESGKRSRSCDELPEVKQWFPFGFLHGNS